MLQANCTDTVVPSGHRNHSLHNHIYKLWFSLVEYMFSVKVSKKIATLSDAVYNIPDSFSCRHETLSGKA